MFGQGYYSPLARVDAPMPSIQPNPGGQNTNWVTPSQTGASASPVGYSNDFARHPNTLVQGANQSLPAQQAGPLPQGQNTNWMPQQNSNQSLYGLGGNMQQQGWQQFAPLAGMGGPGFLTQLGNEPQPINMGNGQLWNPQQYNPGNFGLSF